MAHVFCVASVEAVPVPRQGQAVSTVLRQAAVENMPCPGETYKFQPEDGRVLAPGVYLLMGKLTSGIFTNDAGKSFPWKRITGVAVPTSLADGEKALAAMIGKLQK